MDVHWQLANGHWPDGRSRYQARRRVAARARRSASTSSSTTSASSCCTGAATGRLLKACCKATECSPRTYIIEDHELTQWKFGRLLATILDSPAHFSR